MVDIYPQNQNKFRCDLVDEDDDSRVKLMIISTIQKWKFSTNFDIDLIYK